MSTIGSVTSSSSAYSSHVQRQRPDPSKIADSVFSKLDTKGQGYLEVSDLESAFSSISSTSSSDTSSSTNSTGSTTSTTSNSASVSDLFKTLDSNSDGKVTKDEFSSGLKKLSDALETQFNARRTSGAGSSEQTNQPPPPPDGAGKADDAGLSQSQLTELAGKVSETNSSAGAGLTSVAKNFDAADTNQDGKVSMKETLAYLEKVATANSTSSTTSTTSTSAVSGTSSTSGSTSSTDSSSSGASNSTGNTTTSDAAMFKKVMQLLHAYSDPFQTETKNISVSA